MLTTMFSNLKNFIFSLIILSIILLFLILNNIFLTINYENQLRDEFQNVTTFLKTLKNPDWFDVIAQEIKYDKKIKIGLVNIIDDIITQEIHGKAEIVKVNFKHVSKKIKWSDLFPPWISETSKCLDIPMTKFEDYRELDVIVASFSRYEKCKVGGSRDVFRLQVNLVVANLVVKSGRKDNRPVFTVFLGSCGPMWEIFRCDDLLWHEGNSWVYKPQLSKIREIIVMPVGICQYIPSFSQLGGEVYMKNQSREAYVTILHSSEDYVCGAITLAQSIIQSNSTKDLILLFDDHISEKSLDGLRASGWKVKHIQRIRSSHATNKAYNRWNYTKLRIWQLKEYDKVMFMDADIIVKRSLDKFFMYPQLTAPSNYEKHFFNSGLMLVEPSICTFETLMKKRFVVKSYNGGDQGFLNEMFTWWHRLPAKTSHLKIYIDSHDMMRQVPDDVYTIHYLGLKPWKCRKSYDCNSEWLDFRPYSSNLAHEKWLDVFYRMPDKLRQYCPLVPQKDAKILQNNV